MPASTYWVYILHCENNTYYTGYTVDLMKRYQTHYHGTGKCKYTRSFKPIAIAQCWQVAKHKALAMKIERHIKNLTRAEKEILIAQPKQLCKYFPTIKTTAKRKRLQLAGD